MSKNPAKDFDVIADDYSFFETHSTEPQNDARAYAEQLQGIASTKGVVRMLDFGCGSGNFTTWLLKLLLWPPERLRLTLVEPAEAVRKLAVERLAGFTDAPITDASRLPDGVDGSFDFVLANHVMYYVPDLKGHLQKLIGALDETGVFLTAIAGRSNALIEFWIEGFGALGREIPYHLSEDIASALRELGANYEKQEVPYELNFPDTEENRLRIIRFLLSNHLAEMPLEPLLALFDKYRRGGQIEMRTACDHYRVRICLPATQPLPRGCCG